MEPKTGPTDFTHLMADGTAAMVDVSAKPATERTATAKVSIRMLAETIARIRDGNLDKGDVFAVARVAGIMAAKRTSEIIPLCHLIQTSSVSVDIEIDDTAPRVNIAAHCRAVGPTGVEMEAMTAAAGAALTIYDMCKAVDRGMRITDLRLTYKDGGRSGVYQAP